MGDYRKIERKKTVTACRSNIALVFVKINQPCGTCGWYGATEYVQPATILFGIRQLYFGRVCIYYFLLKIPHAYKYKYADNRSRSIALVVFLARHIFVFSVKCFPYVYDVETLFIIYWYIDRQSVTIPSPHLRNILVRSKFERKKNKTFLFDVRTTVIWSEKNRPLKRV